MKKRKGIRDQSWFFRPEPQEYNKVAVYLPEYNILIVTAAQNFS